MRNGIIVLSVIICFFYGGFVFAKPDPSIAEIEKVKMNAERLESLKTTKEVMLGTTLQENDDVSDWKICDPKKNIECNDDAHLYFKGRRLSSFHIRLGTPTGDWGEHSWYCYRNDETLAFIAYEYWTFCEGSIKIEAKLYFDPKGKKVKEIVKFMDIQNGKPVKAQKELYSSPDVYLKAKDALKKFQKDLKEVTPPWTTFK